MCPPNTHTPTGASDINGCLPCVPPEYSKAGSGYCSRCNQNEFYSHADEDCVCEPKFYRIESVCTYVAGETLMGTECQACET